MKTIHLATTSALAATLALLSAPLQAETLLQIYQQAKGYDAQLKSQESDYLATLENKPQALAATKPQVNFSANAGLNQQYTVFDGRADGGWKTSNVLSSSYTLSVTKSIYNRTLDAQIDKVDSVITQASTQLEGQRQALIMRVILPYFEYLQAKENLQLASTETNAVKHQLKQVKDLYEEGKLARTDMREAEARYSMAAAREVSTSDSLDTAREKLRVLTGKIYQNMAGPQPNLSLTLPTPQKVEAWVGIAKRSSKVLQVYRQAIEVAQKDIEIQRTSERNPVVNIFARQTGGFTEGSSLPLDPRAFGANVGVEVNIPLYQGGAVPSKIRQAQHNFRQAQQEYDYQERLIEQQVRSAFMAIESTITLGKAQQSALKAAQTAAEATKIAFEAGMRTAVDVLTSLRDVFSARRDYASTRYNYLLSTLQLRQAAGTLGESDVRHLSSILNKK